MSEASKPKRRLKVLLFGYNGENNTGSESRLVTILRDVRKLFGETFELDLGAVVLEEKLVRRYTKDPDVKMVELGTSWPLGLKWIPRVLALMFKRYDVMFLVEGSTFTDHFSPFLLYSYIFATLMCRIVGCRVIAYAVDCGKLKPFNRKLARWGAEKMDLLVMRSYDARERLVELGVKKPVITTTDTAFQYLPPPADRTDALIKRLGLDPSRPFVGVAPKEFFWFPIMVKLSGPKEDIYRYPYYHTWGPGDKERGAAMKETFTRYIDWVTKELDANVLIFCMERMDYPPSRDIFDKLERKDRVRVIPSNDFDLEDITGLFSRLKFLTSTRYHACVLSVCDSTPMIGVSHDIRIEALFKEMDTMDYYVAHDTPDLLNVLTAKTKMLLENESALRGKVAAAYPKFMERCMENRSLVRKWFNENLSARFGKLPVVEKEIP